MAITFTQHDMQRWAESLGWTSIDMLLHPNYLVGYVAFDGWKVARIPEPKSNMPHDIVDALKKEFKKLWREGALRGVKS